MTADVVRRPRVRLSINGTIVPGCLSVEIKASRGSCASTFRVEVSTDAVASLLGEDWIDADVLSVIVDMALIGSSSTSQQSWTQMIAGPVDRVTFEPLAALVILDGRDNAAKLIDLPIEDGYLNRTASEVVSDLGARCDLTVDAMQTTGLIGQYYQIQHSKTVFGAYSKHSNGWDLLAELAQIQNYELWVDGTTLHFRQLDVDDTPFVVSVDRSSSGSPVSCGTMNAIALDKTIGLSGPIQVKVDSWNSREKQSIRETYPSADVDGAKVYSILKPNLLPDQAQSLATSTYKQLRARQRQFSGWMPGELTLFPRRTVQLTGTGTGWDTRYVIDQVSRHFSMEHGFTQHLTAVTLEDGV